MDVSVVLERGSDGYLAWVIELPGCFTRAAARDAALAKVPMAVRDFLSWLPDTAELAEAQDVAVVGVEEVSTGAETSDGDTEILLDVDRAALSPEAWRLLERWLDRSRADVHETLAGLDAPALAHRPGDAPRSVGDALVHLAFTELMYAAWTFDHSTPEGLHEFLDWTRRVASDRMRELVASHDDALTLAEWSDAQAPEPWTARKAVRRLLWHERLHLRGLPRQLRRSEAPPEAE